MQFTLCLLVCHDNQGGLGPPIIELTSDLELQSESLYFKIVFLQIQSKCLQINYREPEGRVEAIASQFYSYCFSFFNLGSD